MSKADRPDTTAGPGSTSPDPTILTPTGSEKPHSRRSVVRQAALMTASAVGLVAGRARAGALPVPARPDRRCAWMREWEAKLAHVNGPATARLRCVTDDPAWDEMEALQELLAGTPAASLAGVRSQVGFALAYERAFGSLDELLEETLENALATLGRLTGEAAHA